jgi:glucose-6-phosphate 1-dehydrogenase
MNPNKRLDSSIMIIFGAGGDLTWRKLVPALFSLYVDNWLPERFAVIGLGHKDIEDDALRDHLRDGIDKFSRKRKENDNWEEFGKLITYHKLDLTNSNFGSELDKIISDVEKNWDTKTRRIFYLAVPPSLVDPIVQGIHEAHLADDAELAGIVFEKPFGHDLESAGTLNRGLRKLFEEKQIYRIDHYLGKEVVQNIMAIRFANILFEPVWNRNYIDHIQITAGEQVGVGHRGGYYENAGALRDMVQSHLLQLLCLVAMEPPVKFAADEIRNRKVDVVRAIRKYRPEEVHNYAVRGQYGPGWIEGTHVKGYRGEPRVSADSDTETFVALKLFIDNWRWQDIPFYLRTGKRLPQKVSTITLQFRPVPHQAFPPEALHNWTPNRLILETDPIKGIRLRLQAKTPGLKMNLSTIDMIFDYSRAYTTEPPEAYETLLLDVLAGDATLFMRADQVEASWKAIGSILEAWQTSSPQDFPNYEAGTWGPDQAHALIAKDGHSWLMLPLSEIDSEQELKRKCSDDSSIFECRNVK